MDLFHTPTRDGRRIVEGCALVPPRQFIRTSGGSWALPGAVFSGLGRILGGLGGVNLRKIEAKINQFLNASWDLIFIGFCWILEGKMESSWHPDGINNRCQLRKIIFVENLVFLRKNNDFEGSGG